MYTVNISNDDSILQSIKKLLGITSECTDFDQDIMMLINSVFLDLQQIGAGPEDGFSIFDSSAKWADFAKDTSLLNGVKSYVYLRVKLVFDPPSSGVATSLENVANKLEWRINHRAETLDETKEKEREADVI